VILQNKAETVKVSKTATKQQFLGGSSYLTNKCLTIQHLSILHLSILLIQNIKTFDCCL
jgi:hypothetical protein